MPAEAEDDLLRHRDDVPAGATLGDGASGSGETSYDMFSAMLEEVADNESQRARRQQVAEQQRLDAVRGETSRRNAPMTRSEEDQVLLLVMQGYSLREAAAAIGVHHSTISKRAKRDQDFAEAVDRARRKARKDPLHAVRRASQHSWRAAAWLVSYLDRRDNRGRKADKASPPTGEQRA